MKERTARSDAVEDFAAGAVQVHTTGVDPPERRAVLADDEPPLTRHQIGGIDLIGVQRRNVLQHKA